MKSRILAKKYEICIFFLIGFAFSFFQITESKLSREGNILWTAGYVLKILASSALGGVLGAAAGVLLCRIAGRRKEENAPWEKKGRLMPGLAAIEAMGPVKVFSISFLLIAASYLPAYLAYYPGICAYDFSIQLGQITGAGYNDHHSIIHTLLIAFFLWAGQAVWNSATAGIGLFALLQMLALAAAFAMGIGLLHSFRVKTIWLILMQVFCMIFPFHWYMSVSMAKDILFTVFFLLSVYGISVFLRGTGHKSFFGIMLVSGIIGMVLFRTNGKYACLVLLAALLLALWRGKANRRLWGRLFLCCGAAFLAGNLLLSVLFKATGAQQGDRREMLSMPIQQLARCMIYHGGVGVLPEDDGTMPEEAKALINDFLLNEGYREYRADIADPVKRNTNTYVARYRAGEFVGTYLGLLGRYPGDFLNAALAVNAGYFYPGDRSHAWINVNGVDRGLGYVQTRWMEEELRDAGICKASKWESLHQGLEDWADSNSYLKLPGLKYLFVPGTYLWLYALLAGFLMARRRYALCLPLALVLGYYLTLFLGPTVQLRYIYPVMAALPYLALSGCGMKDRFGERQ